MNYIIIVPVNRHFTEISGAADKTGNRIPVFSCYIYIQQIGYLFKRGQDGYIVHIKKNAVYYGGKNYQNGNKYYAGYQEPGLCLNFHDLTSMSQIMILNLFMRCLFLETGAGRR